MCDSFDFFVTVVGNVRADNNVWSYRQYFDTFKKRAAKN